MRHCNGWTGLQRYCTDLSPDVIGPFSILIDDATGQTFTATLKPIRAFEVLEFAPVLPPSAANPLNN